MADIVGGDAVKTVCVVVLAGKGCQSLGGGGLEGFERAAVVGDEDVISSDARAAAIVGARPGDCEGGGTFGRKVSCT